MMQGITAWDLEPHASLSTGCDAVDEVLLGGFPVGLVSEVCGTAGSGKTQLCLQLLLRAQLPEARGGGAAPAGLNASSCYMYSDGLAPLKRLKDLATKAPFPVSLNRVFLEPATDPGQFLHALKSRLPQLMQLHGVRLVVVDSVAAIFRGHSVEKASEAGERARTMFEIVNTMRILAKQYRAVFIVVNQMSANMHSENVPALGLAWSSCVNQRFLLHKLPHGASRRGFQVLFSPYLPTDASATFEITSERLH
ncbi:Aste57867_14947 [Aphanomyces stellatus]|uniref:Aste57867_14947 protein n=1 Tax=Aphanomyces stellatus TaxID=120398 RepID=A0A485L2Y6_9STRA|nr:hypothetical protein As57867_014891 [Aphanomyces stellatus]VFT91761.1 Aste57867_14947 [Aphanomyces stellatus]